MAASQQWLKAIWAVGLKEQLIQWNLGHTGCSASSHLHDVCRHRSPVNAHEEDSLNIEMAVACLSQHGYKFLV